MDWYDCLRCTFRHPWIAGDRDCPNEGLTREEVLGGVRLRGGIRVNIFTISGTRPWEAEGVSRRTWYRRRGGKG